MYELIQAAGNSYYIQSPAKIGLVRLTEKEVCLIDSGSDKDAGRKVRQILDGNGWTLRAVFNTHSHADHIGGNKYLQAQTGCKIYAPGIECDFTRHPVLEWMWKKHRPTYGSEIFAQLSRLYFQMTRHRRF